MGLPGCLCCLALPAYFKSNGGYQAVQIESPTSDAKKTAQAAHAS
jgi:hypothetical protein